MALRQGILLCGLCVCLLLAVALGAGGPSPQDDCYKTATSVPSWCAGKFIRALFAGVKNSPINDDCCELLSCVGEPSCASVLLDVCPPPAKGADWPCPPHNFGAVQRARPAN